GDSTTPDVPILTSALVELTIPAPKAPQALSAPPANTGIASFCGNSSAYSCNKVPEKSSARIIFGHAENGISNFKQISSLHVCDAKSNRSVPAASVGSIANTPVKQ